MRVVIPEDYQRVVQSLDCFRLLEGFDVRVYHDHVCDPDLLAERFADAQALVLTRERTRIDAALLARLPNLKLISQTGRAGPHIDLQACRERGVTVAEGSGSPIAAAELTWALILNARRQLREAINGLYAGRWQVNLGQRLYGQTLGIWGYGKIGRRLARYAAAFDMRVLVWGSAASRQAAVADGHEAAPTREAFFEQADVLSLHLRLLPATRHCVGAADLARMKPDALLVNTSRAELIAPGALLEALDRGRPGQAALDVFEQEPILQVDHPLLRHPRVLCTPHLGYVERHSYEAYFGEAFANVRALLREQPAGLC
ncbi:3-phosphoglycerate dehydrogenase [Pseudomonas sp. EGD-AK9]|uniref:D-2-hydroxyacid dehydrogenase family protein n=1 Tax=Pseudomonas sp. EGD-AK9 TaxID=1386078 RepID=UPI000396EDB6|nr:D-2-hydroxyacid dehydrogenase family protein [Pseudomonas sp. EGD-AK9]ERI53584.1 3-phosphoglycerate dehydrogenase [Pseudomonas sp. EGD-AK9]